MGELNKTLVIPNNQDLDDDDNDNRMDVLQFNRIIYPTNLACLPKTNIKLFH